MGITMSSFEENRRRPLWIFVVLILIAGGGYAFYKSNSAKDGDAAAQMQMPPASVGVHEVEIADVPLTFEYAGRTNGSREVEIRARVSGILMKRSYVEGQAVKQGDVLFEIDPAPFKVVLNQAEARFAQANNDWARAQKLFSAQALSARERDQARANYAQTKAEVETARINLGYTTVTAPISGVTSQESLSEGSLVTADASLLTRLTQLDPLYVNFSAPDSEVLNQRHMISTGEIEMPQDGILRAEIHFGNGSIYAHEGEVNFTDSIIDPQTGTVSNRAVVPNPDNIVMPGQFVRVVVKGMIQKNAIIIPDRAIMQGPQGPFVYIVSEQNTAAIRPVILGMSTDNMRLIEKGLHAGDKVITEGMIKVRPDAPVQIASPEAQPQADQAAQQAQTEEAAPQEDAEMLQAVDTDAVNVEDAVQDMDAASDAETEAVSDEQAADEASDEVSDQEPKADNRYTFGAELNADTQDDDAEQSSDTSTEAQQ